MNMSTQIPFEYYMDILRRRKWVVLGVFVFAVTAAWITCLVTPKVYKSTTVIVIEQQKIPENYVKGIVTGQPQDRLATIQQYILSRTLIKRVLDQFHLIPPAGGADNIDGVIDGMRKNISISTTRDTTFSISFKHGDPVIAQKVTATLASSFIDETIRVREQLVQSANEFLESELEKAKVELETREKAISEFKRENMGELPQQLEANLRALDRLQLQLLNHNETLASRNDRLAMIEKAIKEYETNGIFSPEVIASTGKKEAGTRSSRFRELQQQLARLQASYKETYPDVVYLKEELRKLQALPEEPISEPGQTQSKKTIDPYLRELQRQRDELKLELDALKDKVVRVAKEIKEYEFRVERAPAQEQRLQILMRDYENMQKNYQTLVDKKLNARVSENLERRQKGEQFRIIDPANLPANPDSPDQLKIMIIGLLLGCAGGVGSAVGLEHFARVFRRSEDVENLLGLPVLAMIPDIKMAYESMQGKRISGPEKVGPVDREAAAVPMISSPDKGSLAGPKKGLPFVWPRRERDGKVSPIRGGIAANARLELNLVTKWRPMSAMAEQFRVAATRVVLSRSSSKHTVVVVTSAVSGEGKSTTAANLAYVLAHDLGKSALLIDCDFKKSMVHSYMGITPEPGLVEAVYGDLPVEDCIHSLKNSSLSVLPCGRRDSQAVDLTKIRQLSNILARLRERFEFIVLDAPPVFPLADMNMLGSIADLMIFVVRAGITPQDLIQRAIKTMRPPEKSGVILTGYDGGADSRYLSQCYVQGYGRNVG